MLDRNLPFTDNSEGEYILSDYHMKLHYSQTSIWESMPLQHLQFPMIS